MDRINYKLNEMLAAEITTLAYYSIITGGEQKAMARCRLCTFPDSLVMAAPLKQ